MERWPLWEGRGVIWQKFFWGVQHVYCAKFMLTVYHNVNPIINNIQRDEIHNLNNVLNENVNVTKWTSIVDNLCLLQQYKLMEHNQNTIPWLVINVPYGSIFVTIPDFFISHWKTGPLLRGYFASWWHILLVAILIAIVEQFKKESMYGLSARTKKLSLYRGFR